MSWIVTQDYIRGKLTYLVENRETGERVGEFDWQARAQEFANVLNSGDAHVVSHFKGYSERSESLRCAKMGSEFANGLVEGLMEVQNNG